MTIASFTRIFAAAAGLAMLGCHSMPLHGAPLGEGPNAPPIAVYSVEWWKPLVKERLLEVAPKEFATPAVDPDTGRVIALTRDGYVRALDSEGQDILWSVRTGYGFHAGALVHEGTVYVPGGDGTLYALDVKDGKEKWRYAAGEALATVPVVAGDKVLVVSVNDTLFAVNRPDGKWLWQYRRDQPSGFTIRGASRPLVSFGTAYLGFSDGMLVSLKVEDGTVNWNRQISSEENQFVDVDTAPVLDDAGRLFVASYRDGIFALNPDNGDTLWESAVPGVTNLVSRGEVLFATGDNQLSAYLADNGRVLWTTPLNGRAAGAPVLVRGRLIVPVDNELLFVDATTGKTIVGWDPGQGVSAPGSWANTKLFVLSNTGVLYAMRLAGRSG